MHTANEMKVAPAARRVAYGLLFALLLAATVFEVAAGYGQRTRDGFQRAR